jgi:hypothetical protein
MEVLQTSALPLGYGATARRRFFSALSYVCLEAISKIPLGLSGIRHLPIFETVSSLKESIAPLLVRWSTCFFDTNQRDPCLIITILILRNRRDARFFPRRSLGAVLRGTGHYTALTLASAISSRCGTNTRAVGLYSKYGVCVQ